MDVNVRPRTAVVVITLFVGILAVRFWADGRALELYGPEAVRSDPAGHLYVQVGNQLYEHDASGDLARRHDLGALGIAKVMGAFAFLPDGELLLRKTEQAPGLLSNLATLLRLKNRAPIAAPDGAADRMVRCDLDAETCVPWGEPAVDLGRTFHLLIDPEEGVVYAADTTRHALRKFDLDGHLLASRTDGFAFPNTLVLHDGRLYVVDTNHHRVQAVHTSTERFGETIDSFRVVPPAARAAGQVWPGSLARQGDEWWVLDLRNAMNDGGIYRFDADWQYQGRLSLPEEADPGDLVVVGDRVLVSDARLGHVYQFDGAGERLGDFSSPELESRLAANRAGRLRYEQLSRLAMGGFILALVVGFGVALWVTLRSPDETERPSAEEQQVRVDDPRIRWLGPDRKRARQLRWAIAAMCTFAAGEVAMIFGAGLGQAVAAPEVRGTLLLFTGMVVAVPYLLHVQLRPRIGVLDDFLILRDHRGRHAVGRGARIHFHKQFLAIDRVIVVLGTGANTLFPAKELIEEVYPRLRGATEVGRARMQTLLVKERHPMMVLPVLIVAMVCVAWWRLGAM